MRFTTNIIAVAGLVSIASAHIKMTTPTPFDSASLDNAPLLPDGSDFPCKKGASGNYDFSSKTNMPLGSTQPLALMGSAVHGGGSCQISITYDTKPTKNSVWKVIHTIEGGCPMANIAGNNGDSASSPVPDQHSFQIPTGLPSGDAVLAWTWFNRIGNREMYMNCAPVNIGGTGTAKRAEAEFETKLAQKLAARQDTFLNNLPDMFVANVGNQCATFENFDLQFPNPGASRERKGSFTLGKPDGPGCQKPGSAPAPAPGVVPPKESPPPVENNAPLPGGVFITVAPKPSTPAPTPSAEPAPVVDAPAPSPPPAAPAPIVETPAEQPEPIVEEPVRAPSPPAAPGSTFAAGTPCPADEGQWNCIGGNSFQRCASGQWSVVQSVAAGTQCESGISSAIVITARAAVKREVRFSNAHVRRHVMHRSF